MGKLHSLTWTAKEQSILRAVARSLKLALERAHQTQQLMQQRDALTHRTQELQEANDELEAFTYSA